MSVLGSLVVHIVGDNTQFNKTIAATQKQLNASSKGLLTTAKSMTTVGDTMTKAISLPLLAIGVASVKMAMDFETSMRNVNSISKLSEDEFKDLGQSVIEMSKKFPQSAKELADGLYDIASSGFQGADGLKVLEAAAKAASAGMTTTAVSSKGITAVLNAYGLSADHAAEVSDIMFKTVDKGVITFEELSSTVGDWVGMGKAAGLEFKELSGAIAFMTTKGISASEAGTSLQRLLIGMIKPSEDLAVVINDAGFESGEMMLKTLGLAGTMEILNDATGGSITKLTDLIPEIKGVRGANALLGSGYEELTKYMNEFKDTTGATDVALTEQSKSLSYQLDLLKNSATAVAIELGNIIIPKVKDFMDELVPKVDSLARKFGELTPEMQDNILKWGLIAIAGPPLLSMLGRAATGVIQFKNALVIMNTAIAANPLLLAGTLIAALGVYATKIWLDIEALRAENLEIEENNRLKEDQAILIANNQKITESAGTSMRAATKEDILLSGQVKKTMDDESEALLKLVENKSKNADVTVENTKLTAEEKIAVQDHENAIKSLAFRYPELTAEEVRNKVAEQELKEANEENTDAIDLQGQSVDDLRKKYSELIGVLFDTINTSNAFQEAGWAVEDAEKAVAEAIRQHGEGSREAETAINGLDAASQNYLDTAYGVFTAVEATKEEQEEARKKAIEYGLQLVASGKLSEGSFISMASQFNLSSNEIIAFADAMGIKLDEETQARFIEIKVNLEDAEFYSKFNAVKRTINESGIGIRAALGFSQGGPVGFANGGMVGSMIPKFDNGGMLAVLHPPEVVLNGKEALQLVWNMATKPMQSDSSGATTINVYPETSIDLTDQSNIRIIKQAVAEALNK